MLKYVLLRGGKLQEPVKNFFGDRRDCYEFNRIEHAVPLLAANERLPRARTYGQVQSMHCIYSYSRDAREDGETDLEDRRPTALRRSRTEAVGVP